MNMNYLHVPISVKGLLVGKPPEKGLDSALIDEQHRFADISDDFSTLRFDPMGESVAAQLTVQQDLPPGLHLHWSLPDALTNGSVDERTGEVIFPRVPERWIVTRLWGDESNPADKIKSRSWVVESSALSETRTPEQGNVGSPSIPAENPGNSGRFWFLGRALPLPPGGIKDLPPPSGGYLPELTAVQAENPAFAAFYPACRNVFAFYDDMKDENGRPIVHSQVTYCVSGAYINDADSPLFGVSALERTEKYAEMKWKYTDLSPQPEDLPWRVTCHGMLCGIRWETADTVYESAIPHQSPEVAVGNSSAEALAALIAAHCQEGSDSAATERMIAHMLSGIPQEMLAADGTAKSEAAIHESGFAVHSGGLMYTLKYIDGPEPLPLDMPFEQVSPSPELLNMLERVNALAAKVYRQSTACESAKQELFEAWYRFKRAGGAIEKIAEAAERLYSLTTDYTRGRVEFAQAESALKVSAAQNRFSCAPQTGRRFWMPVAPVVLLAGVNRNYSHGADGRFSKDATLPVRCRTISEIEMDDTLIPHFKNRKDKKLHWRSFVSHLPPLPDYAAAHVVECAIISPSFCLQAAAVLLGYKEADGQKNPAVISEVAELYRLLQEFGVIEPTECGAEFIEKISATLKVNAPYPEKTAVTFWSQPFFPLYIDWIVDYFPDEKALGGNPSIDRWNCKESGEGGLLYDFVFNSEYPLTSGGHTLCGRSFITPHACEILADRLDELRKTIPNAKALSVLSQSLSGIHEQLMQYSQTALPKNLFDLTDSRESLTWKPMGNVVTRPLSEVMKELLKGFSPKPPLFDSLFSPVRAGFFKLREVRIVDVFGQLQRLEEVRPYVSEAVRTSNGTLENIVELPPRVLEPLQLCVDWTDKNGGPVCGYLMTNLIDRSILVFSSEGKQLGCFLSVKKRGGAAVEWRSTFPEGAYACVPDKRRVKDDDLRAFIEGILTKPDDFSAFLDAVNRSVWQINTSSGQGESTASMMLGRPLALVRADLSLNLLNPPHSERQIAGDKKSGLERLKVSVRVGIPGRHGDGTIGFFPDGDYSKLHLSGGGDVPNLGEYMLDDPFIELSPSYGAGKKRVTVLMDPLGEVNLVSGILPVKTVRIDGFAEEKLRGLYHAVFVAPTLQPGLEIGLPLALEEGRRWSWAGFDSFGVWQSGIEPATVSEAAIFSEETVRAREGWIYLKDKC